MDKLKTKAAHFEIDHHSGAINLAIAAGDQTLDLSLSIVEASQLVALLHKKINEAAVETLRNKTTA